MKQVTMESVKQRIDQIAKPLARGSVFRLSIKEEFELACLHELVTVTEQLEVHSTNMAVQLANAESKCRELAEEISRRDAIFVPVYPDGNLMNRMTDVFHDTAKIHCDEDGIFVDNAELVITAIINHYIKSGDAFLAEVRAQGVERMIEVKQQQLDGMHPDTFAIGAVRDSIRRDIYELKVFAEVLHQETAQ